MSVLILVFTELCKWVLTFYSLTCVVGPKGEENTTGKARMFLSVQPTTSRNEPSNALKLKEAILELKKQTISLTSYTLNPRLESQLFGHNNMKQR